MPEEKDPIQEAPLPKKEKAEPLISARIVGNSIQINVLPRSVDRVTVTVDGVFADKQYIHGAGGASIALPATKSQHVVQVVVTHTNNEQTVLTDTLKK